jgi:hypothetical protein
VSEFTVTVAAVITGVITGVVTLVITTSSILTIHGIDPSTSVLVLPKKKFNLEI